MSRFHLQVRAFLRPSGNSQPLRHRGDEGRPAEQLGHQVSVTFIAARVSNRERTEVKGQVLPVHVCRATTLYDRPASFFRETPLELQHELFLRLARTHPQFQSSR